MPLIVVVPAAPVVEPPVEQIPRLAPYVTWTPNGLPERVLTQEGPVTLAPGVFGLHMPPDTAYSTPLTIGDGALLNSRRALQREVILRLTVYTSTLPEFEAECRGLFRDFNPRLGYGQLAWSQPDGTRRTLTCRYGSGLESPIDGHQGAIYYAVFNVVLAADDPYWYGDETSVVFDAEPGQSFFPGPPFYISEATSLGTQIVTIDSEVETFPEWLITGPATTATLSNLDTGKTLSLTPSLAAGGTLRVRTDPRTLAGQKFTNAAGTSVWAAVAGQFPELWALQPGENEVTITVSGTGVGSQVQLLYRPRYLTA
jgi:hypothetical protein